ncbi:MAG: hypothetical protein H8D43_02070 [Chloroflexi bacterium]|nr:hypothetical protein [Chloroflexota bacterium]
MTTTDNTPVSSPWSEDSQAFMHDQYQAVSDHYIAASQDSEQRLQVYFTLLAAAIGLAVALPVQYAWIEIALPVGLLSIGIWTFRSLTYYAWYRLKLAGELDIMAFRWTCYRNRTECWLLLGDFWKGAEEGSTRAPTSFRELIRYIFSWREYLNFVLQAFHVALIATVNGSIVGLLAFHWLSTILGIQYGFAIALLLFALVWAMQALHFRLGTRWAESWLISKKREAFQEYH